MPAITVGSPLNRPAPIVPTSAQTTASGGELIDTTAPAVDAGADQQRQQRDCRHAGQIGGGA